MTESKPGNLSGRVATIGLLLLATFSLAAAWGRKPPKEEEVEVTLRPISASEVMDILRRFPQMVPGRFAAAKTDSEFLRDLFNFSELTALLLSRVFPDARFYHGVGFDEMPGSPYLMAIAGDKRYMMPAGFDRLLFDNGMKVTDQNIIALARPLVIAAIGGDSHSYPQIVFLDATRTRMEAWATDAAQLKVKVGAQTQVWHFDVLRNQFDGASSVNEKGLIKNYSITMVEPPPKP